MSEQAGLLLYWLAVFPTLWFAGIGLPQLLINRRRRAN